MKIGIIIYSRTGNTLSVGEKLSKSLLGAGHTVCLERVTAENEDPNAKGSIRLTHAPDMSSYDYVVIGAPVQAFSLSPIMKAYLSQLSKVDGKNCACFITQHFPKPWMGGSHAMKQMVALISQKEAKVTNKGIVNWTNKAREEQIAGIVAELGVVGSF